MGLPVNVRVHRKGGPTTVALVTQMIAEIGRWLPGRSLHLHAGGRLSSCLCKRSRG